MRATVNSRGEIMNKQRIFGESSRFFEDGGVLNG